jgi:hypothetical protein
MWAMAGEPRSAGPLVARRTACAARELLGVYSICRDNSVLCEKPARSGPFALSSKNLRRSKDLLI